MSLPAAGWFPNPDQGGSGLRWWDGANWTEHYHHEAPPAPPSSMGIVAPQLQARLATANAKVTKVREVGVVAYAATTARRRFAARRGAQVAGLGRAPTVAEVLSQVAIEEPRHPLEEQVEVAGEHFYAKEIRRVFAESGLPITTAGSTLEDLEAVLMPEPWNPHDPNAVAVLIGPHQVGHVPAELAVEYAHLLGLLAHRGYLASGTARLWAKDDGSGIIRARCTVLIPEPQAFTP